MSGPTRARSPLCEGPVARDSSALMTHARTHTRLETLCVRDVWQGLCLGQRFDEACPGPHGREALVRDLWQGLCPGRPLDHACVPEPHERESLCSLCDLGPVARALPIPATWQRMPDPHRCARRVASCASASDLTWHARTHTDGVPNHTFTDLHHARLMCNRVYTLRHRRLTYESESY